MKTANTRYTLKRGAVALVALLVVLSTVSGVAVAAGTTDITVSAAESTLAPGDTTQVTVAVSNGNGGVGSADLRVETSDPGVATIQDVTVEANAPEAFQNVRGDATGQNINFAAATTDDDTGEVVFLTVTVEATAAGTASIDVVDNPEDAVNGVAIGDEGGDSYTIENIGSASITVEEPATPADFQVSDLTAPGSATQGDAIDISATVENTGGTEATKTVEFRIDTDGDGSIAGESNFGSQEVTLGPGATETVTFSDVDTSGLAPDDYTHGITTPDDSATAQITITDQATPANFQVSDLTAPATATQGDAITVSATVENTGETAATKTVDFRLDTDGDGFSADDDVVLSQDVQLNAGASTTVTFEDIDTNELAPGDYTHGVATVDDAATAQITINDPAAPASFQVSNLDAPATATQGDAIDVSATVENTGDESATKTVAFRLDTDGDGDISDESNVVSQDVELAAGASTTVTFEDVDTSGIAAGDYTHGIATPDDSATAQITIEAADAGTTDVLVAAGQDTLAPGDTTQVTVAVSNADNGVGSADLRVELTNPSVAAIQDVTVEANAPEAFQNVRGDATGQNVNFAAATTEEDTGEVVFLTVTLEATAAGSTDINVVDNLEDAVNGVAIGDEGGDSYTIENIGSASITVEEPATPADFQVSDLTAPASATQGDAIAVSATVENTGDESATKTVAFRLDTDGDGDITDESDVVSQDVQLDGGESTTVTFEDIGTGDISPGDNTHGIATPDDSATAQITIEEPEPTDERTIRIQGSGSYVSYELVTDGGFARTDTLQSGDQISADGTTATGGVVSFGDTYTFTGDITSISLSGPATVFIDGEQVDPADFGANTIEFVGDGDRSTYEFSVSGTVTDATGLSGPDAFDGNAGSGAVYGGTDRYTYTGDLESLSVAGGATVLVDGEAVDPADFGDERTIRIEGSGTASEYRFVVSDEVTGGDKLQSTDEFDGRLAEGAVRGGADEYTFTGDLQALNVAAGVTVYVDGEEVDPASYDGVHEIQFVGDGDRTTYDVTVDGEFVDGAGLGGVDSFDGDTASGAVYGGTDTYVYVGPAEPTSLTVNGDATVRIDGQEVSSA